MKKIPIMWIVGASATVLAGVAVWYFFIRKKVVTTQPATTTNPATTTTTDSVINIIGALNGTGDTVVGGTVTTPTGGVEDAPPVVTGEMADIAGPQYVYTGAIDQAASIQMNPGNLHVVVTGYSNGQCIMGDDASSGGENPHYLINSGYYVSSLNGMHWNPETPLTVQLFRSNSSNPADWQSQNAFRGYSQIFFASQG